MARGRKPTPTHLKVVGGNPGRRPMNDEEPKPRRERPSAPAHISDAAREVWGQATLILDEMGVLTQADAFAIEMLCEAMADHRAAGQTIKECAARAKEDRGADITSDFSSDGRYYRTINQAGGVMWRGHPAVALRADADRRIKAWCSEFGMTPSARTRLKGEAGGEGESPAAARYF